MPAGKAHQPCSRAVRASCLPALRPACEVRRWKWPGRRRSDPRPLDGLSTKPGPDRTKGPHTPWEEPWWNAGRRARPIAEGAAQAAPSVARPARRMRAGGTARVCRRSASLILFAGSEPQRVAPQQLVVARSGLDGSPIPRHRKGGGKQNMLFDIARARRSRRGNGIARLHFSPRAGRSRGAKRRG